MKIKLKDLTLEQWDTHECIDSCKECIFDNIVCSKSDHNESWIHHKDLYSDKFLNQEIEIDCGILTEEEKKYLEFVLKPFCKNIRHIRKYEGDNEDIEYIVVYIGRADSMIFPSFEKGKLYKGMEPCKEYTIKELGLWEGSNEN